MGYAQLSNEDNFTVAHVVAQSHPTIAFKIYTRFKDTLGKLATKDVPQLMMLHLGQLETTISN